MSTFRSVLFLASMLLATQASAQAPAVFRDLDPLSPVVLTKDELQALLPGAKMTRTIANGNEHIWANESGGKFIVSTTNRARGGKPTTASGTWQISDDGRYCVLIEWRGVDTEEWCRYMLKTSDGYYATKSTKVGTEKVYKFEISK